MKIEISLSEYEIREAIIKAIKEKLPDLNIYGAEIKIEGSVKIKKKAIRKLIQRFTATVESSK